MSISESIKNKKKILIFIFVVALIVRTIAIVGVNILFKGSISNQDFEYGAIARSLIKGEGYSVPVVELLDRDDKSQKEISSNNPGLFLNYELSEKETFTNVKETNKYRPSANQLPFYPILLAMVYYFSNGPLSFWIITFLQAIFSSATCMIIYLIALIFYNQRVAMISGFISVIYPIFILNVAKIFPESFFTFWLALSVLYLIILRDAPSLKYALIAGILIGITLLNSNVTTPMIPLICLWLFLLRGKVREKFKRTFLVMLTAFLILSPWLIRNYIVFKEFPLMKTTMGLNFWLGNNPNATGTFFLESGELMESILPRYFYEGFTLSETDQDKRLFDDAMSYVKENPMHFVRLSVKRLYYFVWFSPDNILSNQVRLYKKLLKLPYGFILVSGIIGVILSLRTHSKDVFLLLSIMLSTVLLYSVFIVGHIRYRMPIEPYIIIFSSYTISLLLDRFVSHVKRE